MLWWTLHQLKSSNREARAEAARKLGSSKEKKAVSALTALLADDTKEVRRAVIEALGAIAHAAAAEPLAQAMANLAKKAKGRDATLDKAAEYESLAAALQAVGAPAVRPLLGLLRSQEKEPRRWAARALGMIKDPQAIEALSERLEDHRSEVRKAAAHALGTIGDLRALKPLIKALANRDTETRRAAAESLGALGADGAVEALSNAISDQTESVQLAAVEALGRIDGLRAAAALGSAVDGGKKTVREAAATALKSMKFTPSTAEERAAVAVLTGDLAAAAREGYAALGALVDALGSRDAGKRRQAADALAALRSELAVSPLLKALRDHDQRVQASAGRALASIGSPAVDGLVDALASPDASVQREAARALGEIGEIRAVRPLAETIMKNRNSTDEYPETLEAARAAADSLLTILNRSARAIDEQDLQRITSAPNCVMIHQSAEDQWHWQQAALDCTSIRDLARQELVRRGILTE